MPEAPPHAVAIVGAGIGGGHMDGYLALPARFRVAAVCDLDRERAQALAGRAPGARVETDLRAVLDDPAVGIVDICLPPSLHAEVVLRALAAGKHVVCEKPLAASLEEVDRMIAAAEAAGRQVVPVFQYRFGHGIRRLRHLVDAGLAGRAYTATLETHWDRDAASYGVAWRGTWDGELGGAVVSHAIHAHDLLCHVLGPAARVGAFPATRVNDVETEDCASIALEMENGALAAVSPGPERFAGFFAALDRRLRGAEGDGVSPADGRRSIELATAVYAAARTDRTIALPLAKNDPYYRGWRRGPLSPGGRGLGLGLGLGLGGSGTGQHRNPLIRPFGPPSPHGEKENPT